MESPFNSIMKVNLLFKLSLLLFAVAAFSHAKEKPVKVFILSGQSNMVGAGKIDGGGTRWGDEMIDPVVSVYEGAYDPKTDYDALKPSKTLKLESFGGTKPTPYPGGGVQVTRGFVQLKETGMYEFRPGYGGSSNCLMEVDGKEVHRQEAGGEAVRSEVKLEGGKKVPFKITYFTGDANGLGWTARLDVPGSLKTLVKFGGKYPYLMNDKGQWTARDDVYYRGVVTATGSRWMGVAGGRIGPELGFGHSVGEAIDEPAAHLPKMSLGEEVVEDYASMRLSLRAHPVALLRHILTPPPVRKGAPHARIEPPTTPT